MFQKNIFLAHFFKLAAYGRCFRLASLLIASFTMTACTMSLTPAEGTWVAPARFSEEKIYSAFVPAAAKNGYQPTFSDQNTGTISFTRRMSTDGQLTLTAIASKNADQVAVNVSCKYNSLAVAGMTEEQVNFFFNSLFDNLGITEPTERDVRMVVE